MADKKVERTVRPSEDERPATRQHSLLTPSEKGGPGLPAQHDMDAKSALLEKFKAREQLSRADQDCAQEAGAIPEEGTDEGEALVEQ